MQGARIPVNCPLWARCHLDRELMQRAGVQSKLQVPFCKEAIVLQHTMGCNWNLSSALYFGLIYHIWFNKHVVSVMINRSKLGIIASKWKKLYIHLENAFSDAEYNLIYWNFYFIFTKFPILNNSLIAHMGAAGPLWETQQATRWSLANVERRLGQGIIPL